MRWSRRIVAAAWLLLGCGVPKEAGFSTVAAAVEQRSGHRIFWNQGGAADAAVATKVREMLAGDLTRAEAVQIALVNNRSLQATYEELTIAQADVVQAGLLKNPVFSGRIRFPTAGPIHAPSYDVGVDQDFLDLLLIPARKRLASAAFEAAKLRVGQQVLDVAHDVRVAYYTMQGAQQVAAMRRAILEASEASAELARRQHDAGNISDLDLGNEEALYEQVRLDLMRSESDILGARERLNRLLGLWGQDTSWTIAPKLPDLPADEPALEHLESAAIAQRLDVDAARHELQASSYALAMATNWRWLGFSVGASFEHDPEGRTVAGPGVSLEVPIFDQKQATVARLAAQYRQSRLRLSALSIDARSEVREARGRLLGARAVADRYRTKVIPLRERLVALSQQHYDAMLLGVYQLLLAKQSEVNAYREYIEAVRDYWIARANLERAVGGRIAAAVTPASPPASPAPADPPPQHLHP